MVEMKMIGQDIGVIDLPFRVLGAPLGKSTTVIRLSSGEVLVHSAGPLREHNLAAIRELGEVKWLMEGSRLHDTFALRLRAAFPLTDLVFNLAWEPGEKIPFFLRWISGFRSFPGTSRLVKLGVKDKAAVRQSLERIMAEEFEQVVVGHGLLMRDRAKERLREVLAWSLGQG